MQNSMFYNGFNPYMNMMPNAKLTGRNILSGISKINWGNILNNTQKTLNVINQAIPVYYQVKPIYNNAKTMFRLIGSMNEKTSNREISNYNNISNNLTDNYNKSNTNEKNINNKPIFFT